MEAKLQKIDVPSNGRAAEEIIRRQSESPPSQVFCAPTGEGINDTGFSYTLSLIGGK